MGPPPAPPASRGRSSVPTFGQSNGVGINYRRDRSQSSNKRPRVEEEETNTIPETNNLEPRSRSQSKARKFLIGTLNTKEAAGRKMKSPPADIFIYGVHPETTVEDIVNDLEESDILSLRLKMF